MKIVSLRAVLFFLGPVILLSGCKRAERQFEAEGRAVMGIMRMLDLYSAEHPGVQVTNLSQLIPPEQGYPHSWHQQMARFGKHSGFTNSVFEKYVFFSPGITNHRIQGELLLMNAKPYPGPRGLERKVVSQLDGRHYYQVLQESHVQSLFDETGLKEPKPTPMPPPPPTPPDLEFREPLSVTVDRFYIRLAEFLGTGKWWILRDATIGVLLIILVATTFFIWRTRSRRRRFEDPRKQQPERRPL